ncbi:MAG: hypothetical protein SGPRY_000138 [Prymnesium sp.]
MLRPALLAALLAHVCCKGVAPSLASQLKAQGDARVVSVACCGLATSLWREALDAPSKDVSVVQSSTPVLLASVDQTSDASAVLSASDVLALEVKFTDLANRSPLGLAQLAPLLHRVLRLRHIRPQKKLLVLAVTDFDSTEISEEYLTAFVNQELQMMAADVCDDGTSLSSLLELKIVCVPYEQHQPQAYERAVRGIHDAFTAEGSAQFMFADGQWSAPASALASCLDQPAPPLATQVLLNEPLPPQMAAPPADVHTAYQCGLMAEAAAREFNKGASALRKAADSALIADFGEKVLPLFLPRLSAPPDPLAPQPSRYNLCPDCLHPPTLLHLNYLATTSTTTTTHHDLHQALSLTPRQAGELLEGALERFDTDAAPYEGSRPARSARASLEQQLVRSLYAPFRKQLAALQRKSLASLRQKLSLKEIVKDAGNSFESQATHPGTLSRALPTLLDPRLIRSHEPVCIDSQAVLDTIKENVALHLHTLQVQGLYLPTEGVKLPIDNDPQFIPFCGRQASCHQRDSATRAHLAYTLLANVLMSLPLEDFTRRSANVDAHFSAHWLGLHPFGRDSRYDPIGADDSPAFRPQAAPMSLRASTGYRPRTKRTDPTKMVFTDKMIQ